jgi:hypothetical protein
MSEEGFERIWREARGFRNVSRELRGLLRRAYEAILASDVDGVKASLIDLFEFLASPEGRTDANCTVTDYFFCSEQWERNWMTDLPQPYLNVLADISGALHDTIHAPKIASTFESTPEQLLERIRNL